MNRRIFLLGIAAIVSTFVFAYAAVLMVSNQWPPGPFSIWNHWDSTLYLNLVHNGYADALRDKGLICFYPFYPWLVRMVGATIGDSIGAGLLISNLCFLATLAFLYKLARLDMDERAANRTILLFICFPTAYFLHGIYTESLFLLFATAGFYCVRTNRWPAAIALAAVSSGTRMEGLAMLPFAFIELFENPKLRKGRLRKLPTLLLMPAGFAIYLWINYHFFGNPLEFIHAQQSNFTRTLSSPLAGIQTAWRFWTTDQSVIQAWMVGGAELVFGVLMFVASLWVGWRVRWSYGAYMLSIWALCSFNNFWMSMPRHMVELFPVFFALGNALKKRWAFASVLIGFLFLQTVFLLQFINGRWAF